MAENLKYKYIFFFVLLLYIVLVFIVGYHHEPWADEAQSWLIARDNGFWEIFKETKYEGHPFVWFYIEKTIIKLCHFFINPVSLYNYIFLIPLCFSAFGVYLLLYKSDFPLWIKILSPFTFYIFYQYGIIARNHCLAFPILAIIAVFYKKRFEHPYIFILLLIFNANISAYLFVVSCILLLFFIIDIIKDKLYSLKVYSISSFTAVILLFLSAVSMFTRNGYFWEGVNSSLQGLCERLTYISGIYFPAFDSILSAIICFSLTVLFYICTMNVYCKNNYQRIFFILLNFSLYLVYMFIYAMHWHFGYALIVLLFSCWVLSDINKIGNIPFKNNKLFYCLFSFIIGYYIITAVQVGYFDIKNSYSSSKEAAEFIKKYNLQNYKITALGMKSVALQPYFTNNIYNNYGNTTHFSWNNDFLKHYNEKREELTPVVVGANFDMMFFRYNHEDYIKKLDREYNKYNFFGEMRGLNYNNGNIEDNSYTIYIDKDLAKRLNIEEKLYD